MLRDALNILDEYEANDRNPMQETVEAWLSGDEKKLLALLDDGFGKDPVLRERAAGALLWERNHKIADRIADEMRGHPSETIFFAVGALHMPDPLKKGAGAKGAAAEPGDAAGENEKDVRKLGIVSLLREKGYTLERVRKGASTPVEAGSDK